MGGGEFRPKVQHLPREPHVPLINAARHVCFLVNSKGKDAILAEVFSGKSNYPCAAVRPTEGNLTWILGA